MNSLLPISDDDLARLNQFQAVELFRALLWDDAAQAGIPSSCVRITHRVNAPDGGIDATVEADPSVERVNALIPGNSSFQVKSGRTFRPHLKSHIKKELFGGNHQPSRENLKPGIRRCLEENGTYVLVCFGANPTEEEHKKSVSLLEEQFCAAGFPEAREPKVYGTTQILGFLLRLPVIAHAFSGRQRYRFATHEEWSSEENMQTCLELGEEQQAVLVQIRAALIDGKAGHIRVAGEPGVGKTRLVLEATRDPSVACNVAYYEDPAAALEDRLIIDLRAQGSKLRAILVIDDCSTQEFSPVWNKLSACKDRVRVVTIAHDEIDDRDTETIRVPPLGTKEICKILESDAPIGFESYRWAEFCEGSPRFAHLIRQSLATDCEQVLMEPNVDAVVDRIVAGPDPYDSTVVRRRRIVLRYIALFQRFGFEQPVEAEGEAIAALIRTNHPEVGSGDFGEAIRELRRRRILQGRRTIYIVPKALQIHLWREWWENYAHTFDLETFQELPVALFEWFMPLLRYARTSQASLSAVRHILSSNGSYQSLETLGTPRNAKFFSYLTEADPEAALARLEILISAASRDDLRTLEDGRIWIIDALEKIVVWKSLFVRGARLLKTLVTSTSKNLLDSSESTFCGLFSIGRGGCASTEASPEERFPLLSELLDSNVVEERRLGRAACKAALSLWPHGRSIGSEHQGLRRQANLWHPKTWGELDDAYRRIWNRMESSCWEHEEEERLECADVLFDSFGQLVQCEWICEDCLGTLERLAEDELLADRVTATIVRSLGLQAESLPLDVRDRLRKIHDGIVEKSFRSRLRRYVGTNFHEDYSDNCGWEKIAKDKIRELVEYAIRHVSELEAELPWLVNEADSAFQFGIALSERDPDRKLLPAILRAQREAPSNRSPVLLAGYLKPIADQAPDEWDHLLERVAADERMAYFVIYVIWACDRLCDDTAVRITRMLKSGVGDPLQLGFFRWGRQVTKIKEAVLMEWIAIVLQGHTLRHCYLALQLIHTFYCHRKKWRKLPTDLCIEVLTQEPLFTSGDENAESHTMGDYYWTQLAEQLIVQCQDAALPVIQLCLSHAGDCEGIFRRNDMSSYQVFVKFVSCCSDAAWDAFFAELKCRNPLRQTELLEMLGGIRYRDGDGIGCWPLVPQDRLWRWVEEFPARRIGMLGRQLPATLRHEAGPTVTREFIHRYGDCDDARRSLYSRFWGGTIIGKRSEHHRKLIGQVLEWKEDESSTPVNTWIDGLVEFLNTDIERAEIEEERSQH